MKQKIFFGILIAVVLAVIYTPIVIIVIYSFSTNATMGGSFSFGFDLYRDLFSRSDIMPAFWNSMLLATVSAFLATIIGTMACLTIWKMSARWRKTTLIMNNVPLVTADIILAFGLGLGFAALGIFNAGWFMLILSHTLIALPIVAIMVLPKLKSLDPNMFDAGQDLGATPARAFWGVIVPQLLPAMIIAFLLGFTFSMNDFIITSHNNAADSVTTLPIIIYQTRFHNLAAFRALAAIKTGLVLLVVLLLYFFAIRRKKNTRQNSN
ncbi:MAG: ABC transporter permease [Firmicutes bacterium]|nr:ABC transporter permease [Bacillota bacterium]